LNYFQKYLSYVNRITVEKIASKYNKKLVVAIEDGRYVLNATNANYSFASLHKVFQKAFYNIRLKEKKVSLVLVLGCGAGSIPSIIYKELKLSPKMDVVEIDEAVIKLGKKYFNLSDYNQLNIIIDDALNFVKTTSNKYDLICVDIFKGINVPEEFLSQHFFEHLKTLLNENGELLFNYVAYNHETKALVQKIQMLLTKYFSHHQTFKIEGINRVFYAVK